MNINDLTIGQAKELSAMFGSNSSTSDKSGLNKMVGKKVIIRTYSAGVWFGLLVEKCGNEVILQDARRMWRWHTKKSLSLSAVSLYGVNHDKSEIAPAVKEQWLEAIEITPCTNDAILSIEGADDANAK